MIYIIYDPTVYLIPYHPYARAQIISLLLRRPPGREAYPGDVFY